MGSPSVARGSRPRGEVAAFPWNQWQRFPGMGGRLALESVAAFVWNRWQLWHGISGNVRVESPAGLPWNQWQVWRGIRSWPDGITCPRCGSDAVELRERYDNGLQRFNCVPCAVRLGQQFAMFTDWTSSIFEESKLRPLEWLLVIGLWQLKLNATEIATAADIQERTAQRCSNLLDGGIYETYHLDPTRQLEHHVEADECYQSAGRKGLPRDVARRDRAPRQRGLQLRGRATAETGRPPLLGLGQRRDKADQDAPAAQVYLEVLENVHSATIKPIIAAKVKGGAQFFTDEYSIYHLTKADYDHRTVNHGAG